MTKQFRPLVYICSPFSGNIAENTERTKRFCRFALEQGQIPLATTLMFPAFMDEDDPSQRELAITMDLVLMGKCQELWVLGDRITSGMAIEINRAKKRKQKIRYFNDEFQEVEE